MQNVHLPNQGTAYLVWQACEVERSARGISRFRSGVISAEHSSYSGQDGVLLCIVGVLLAGDLEQGGH